MCITPIKYNYEKYENECTRLRVCKLKIYTDFHRVDALKYQIIQILQFLLNTTNKI